MTVQTNDIIKTVVDYFYPGAGTALNIFYHKLFDAPQTDTDVLDALETFFDTEWGELWDEIASDQATLGNISAQIVSPTGVVLRDLGSRVINRVGTEVSQVMPAAVSGYMQAYTQTPQIRGSKYVPGIAETAVDNGQFNATATTNLVALLTQYLDNVLVTAGNNLVPGVLSDKVGDFVAFTDSGSINTIPAYQRRRKEGVGS